MPWNGSNAYSRICKELETTNLYCDVIFSFDNPDDRSGKNWKDDDRITILRPWQGESWKTGKGIVAWNEYDNTGEIPRYDTTVFPLAATEAAYKMLYEAVFRTLTASPKLSGFDSPDSEWGTNLDNVHIDYTEASEGNGSMRVEGCGYIYIDSPKHLTTSWGSVGDTMLFDVKQAWPGSTGDIQMFASIPEAGVYNQPMNEGGVPVALSSLPVGEWTTVELIVPEAISNAFYGDYSNAQFFLVVNKWDGCDASVYIDNLRWGGAVTEREVYHVRPSSQYNVRTNDIMSFDDSSLWTATAPLTNSDNYIEGSGSTSVEITGWTEVTSQWFYVNDLPNPTRLINIDVGLPTPTSNPYWFGDIQMFWDCSSQSRIYLGWKPFSIKFDGEYNSVQFYVPDQLWSILNNGSPVEQCRIIIDLNGTNSGPFLLDNMGFVY